MTEEKQKKEPGRIRQRWRAFRKQYGAFVSPFLFLFVLWALDFLFRAVYNSVSIVSPWDLTPNTFTLCWSILFTVIALVLPNVAQKIWMGVVLFAYAALPLVHAVIFNVNGNFLAFSDLAFAEDGMAFLSIAYLSIPWQMYVFTILLTAIGVLAIMLAPRKQSYKPLKLVTLVVAAVVCTLTIIVQNNAYIQTDFGWDTAVYYPNSKKSIYSDFINTNKCLTFCGGPHYVARSIYVNIQQRASQDEKVEALDSYYANHTKLATPNEMTGLFEGKNVICILGESIDTWLLNEKIMPNLYALQQKSINFTDHYTPLFLTAGTFNTECALNFGYYLPASGTTARTYAVNQYPQSLPNVFRGNGYTAKSFHQLTGKFYNREVVHITWGYESYNEEKALGFKGNIYRDTSLMEQVSYQKMVSDDPFLSFIITYSGHGPFNEGLKSVSDPHLEEAKVIAEQTGVRAMTANEDTWRQYTYAIAHAMETDEMIGMLIDNLTADGHIDDTVILFFGDHYCKYLTDEGFVKKMKGAQDKYSIHQTPFFIYSNDLEDLLTERGLSDKLVDGQMNVDKVTASADMLPTLLNLMGFTNYDPTYYAGSDAFSEYGGFVAFRDYSWYDGTTWFTPNFDMDKMTPEIEEKCREVREYLNASWDTVITNYFGKVKLPKAVGMETE